MRKVLMVLMALALVAALPTGALAQGQVLGLAAFNAASTATALPDRPQALSEQELQIVEGSAWWLFPLGIGLAASLSSCSWKVEVKYKNENFEINASFQGKVPPDKDSSSKSSPPKKR